MSAATESSIPPNARVMGMLAGKWIAQAIATAATLELADHLGGEAKTVAELAAATGVHAPSLYRLLRALASVGVFIEGDDGRFANTPLSSVLRGDAPGSLRGMARFMGREETWAPWGHLLYSVRTGRSAFEKIFGEPFFDHLAKNPELCAAFDEGMSGASARAAEEVAGALDVAGVRTLMDVGGGQGVLLSRVLLRQARQRGVLFDRPQVVAGAAAVLAAAGVAGRVEIIGGDFFKEVPGGADGYLLKSVLHDWDDERALAILRAVRRAAPAGARLFVIEAMITPGNHPSIRKLGDLEMLVIPGGKERTERELAGLLGAAGFALGRVVPAPGHLFVLEATPAPVATGTRR